MNRAIDWFARNGVAANLIMLLILFGGLLTVPTIKQEVFPEFSLDMVTVDVTYLGAAPEEVEQAVSIRIEEAIQGLDGIKRIISTASEGRGSVMVELELGADTRKAIDDIKARVDAIDTFPEETEKPVVREITARTQVVDVAVSGAVDEAALKQIAQRVRDDLSALPDVTQVEVIGARPYEIAIEVSEDTLRRHGLTFDDVAQAVRRSSLDLPGGSVRTDAGEILLRTKGQAYRGGEFERLVLWTRADGSRLHLGEVAQVVDGFAETDQFARFDGEPAILVRTFRTGDQAALRIADEVTQYVNDAGARLPEGVSLTIWQDQAKILNDRLSLLLRNGATGFVLVFLVLALFLRLHLAFWVSLGIPLSFLGALWLMPTLDVSISLISLFAFILVLGMLVDDAIIVGENVHTHQEARHQAMEGAIEGTRDIAVPVTFAVLTTVAAFLPLLFVPGTMGKIMRVIPMVVISSLLFSLFESLFILPAHLSHVPKARRAGPIRQLQDVVATGLSWFIHRVYRPTLEAALRWRYLSAAIGMAMLILSAGVVAGGMVRFEFFPTVEADLMSASVTMPQGTPVEVTSEAVRRLEESAARLRREIEAETGADLFRHVFAAVGDQPLAAQSQGPFALGAGRAAAHLGEVTIELAPAEGRDVTSEELAARWRDLTGAIPEAVEVKFNASLFNPGSDIDVQLAGYDLDGLRAAAADLKTALREYAGVYEIADSFREGKQEIRLQIQPQAELLGLTLSDLGRQVRQAFYGEEAQRIQRDRDDIRVMVRYPAGERRSLADLENLRVRTPSGGEVPFSQVAVVEGGRGYATIRRADRQRAINVTASVDAAVASSNDVIADLEARVLPVIQAAYPGVSYSWEGMMAEQQDTIAGLQRGFLIGLLLIFSLLAIPLRSYLQPLIIMSAIPFGMVGALAGHLLMGETLSMMSMFGIVALSGVVVNDSLVMVDFINRKRRAHDRVAHAIREAGVARFRPILLTSATTFAGLAPLLLEKSMQAKFLIPMALSLAAGVIFATVITLVLVPVEYLILEDIRAMFRRVVGQTAAAEQGGSAMDSAEI